jgi:diguanylate cyclase (GGDEF)-like protein
VITTIAAVVTRSFSKRFRCYRLGGDEIVIIGKETDQGKIESSLKTMTSALQELREQGVLLPTVSYGYSVFRGGEKPDFYKKLKEADEQMYRFKRVQKADATH